nr:DUF5994 family protein [Brevibacterium album]
MPTQPSRPHLRIEFAPSSQHPALPAAWWPRTDDLQRELAHLIEEFPVNRGRISHVRFAYADWRAQDNNPGLYRVATRSSHGLTAISLLAESPAAPPGGVVELALSDGRRLRTLAIPFDADPDLALSVMDAIASGANRLTEAELARMWEAGDDDGLDAWDGEGGAPGPALRSKSLFNLS